MLDDDNAPLTYVPGRTFDYLNFGYLLLGRVIERVSGMSYADYVRQHVLAPCGITDMHIAGDTLADPRTKLYITRKADGILTRSGFLAWTHMEGGLRLQRISFVSSFASIVSPLSRTS